jgi:predicted unusual protein kinase regulating ubiquinone biosynthesis (AarF/ABC1/UbiB family)
MEWVDGAKLNDLEAMNALGLDGYNTIQYQYPYFIHNIYFKQYGITRSKLVDILVECSLQQMLENGFFHADPHAGNLIAMKSGKLCYLDFGMVSYVESSQRSEMIYYDSIHYLINSIQIDNKGAMYIFLLHQGTVSLKL